MPIPDTLGWYQIPNTQFQSVQYGGTSNQIMEAYGGGAFDSLRNRLLVWGGGHNDYFCNEFYALNLSTLTVERLNNPCCSPDAFNDVCTGSSPAQPQSRHSYGMIEYIPGIDKFFTSSYAWDTQSEWLFSFASMSWQRMFPSGRPASWYGIEGTCGWDPVNSKVYFEDIYAGFNAYDPSANSWTHLGSITDYVGYGNGGLVIDPVRRKAFTFGGGTCAFYSLTGTPSYNRQSMSTSGGAAIINATNPGMAYDPVTTHIICWAGGDTVYEFNPDTLVFTPHTYSNGPGAQQLYGTHGRWRYSAALGVFVLANAWAQNCFTFRLTSLTPDTEPPTNPSSLTATTQSPTQINLGWTASTDNIGVAQYRVQRCFGASCSNFAEVAVVTTNSYSDTNLTPATLYRYRVLAEDAAGNASGFSNIAEDTTQAADTEPPTDPSNLQATVAGYNRINLAWTGSTDNVGVANYRIERCSGVSCTGFVQIATVTGTTFADTTLAQNTAYRYRVRAVDAAGNFSGYSNIASGTTTVAGVLQVGSTKAYATLSAALAVAVDGDTIECDPEVYQDSTATISLNNITIRGVGVGYAHFKWDTGDHTTGTTYISNGQAILIVTGTGITFENLEFSGARVIDGNGAGIRYNGGTFTIRNCYFHNCQSGVLGQSSTIIVGPILTIEYSIFDTCGYYQDGFSAHNVYIGRMPRFIFRHNISVNSIYGSHTFKSRSEITECLYNFISTKGSDGSIEVEFPNGHTAYVIGNVIQQGDASSNSTILSFGAEGFDSNVNHELYVINNTFYNWRSAGCIYIQMVHPPAIYKALNNAYDANGGTWRSGTATQIIESNNVSIPDADWVDPANGDFHLVAGSNAIDAGINPQFALSESSYALNPIYEYVSSASRVSRFTSGALDAGAYELGGGSPPNPKRIPFSRHN